MTLTLFKKDLQDVATQLGVTVPSLKRSDGEAAGRRVGVPAALEKAASEALAEYRASPDYAAYKAELSGLNLYQAQARLAEALNGPHFAPLLERLRAPQSLEIDPIDFIPKAVSLGLLVEAVLVVGVSGSVGYVVNVDISNFKSGVYAGGAFDWGADIALEGEVCVGFWANAIDDLSGVYVGAEVDVDEGLGVSGAAFLKKEEPGLLLVGLDFGVGDGFEGTDFYFFEFDVGHTPIYQPGDAQYLVQLGTLTCDNSKDNWDTVYFNFLQDSDKTQYRYPAWDGYQMCESQNTPAYSTWGVGLIAKFNSSLTLQLQVGDHQMPDVTVKATDFSGLYGTHTYTFDDKTGLNEIKYTVVAQLIKN